VVLFASDHAAASAGPKPPDIAGAGLTADITSAEAEAVKPGDIDGSGAVETSDISLIVDYIFGTASPTEVQFERANVDASNETLDIADLLGMIEIITGNLVGVTISEFLASNSQGLEDEDGDTSDWVELYNAADTASNLQGWVLTNGPGTAWTFPDVTIGSGEYLVVFASGKDRKPSPVTVVDGVSNLHTSFQLAQNGEYLALQDPEGVIHSPDLFDPQYPTQMTDASYGRYGLLSGLRYYAVPTPGGPNAEGDIYEGIVADTVFSVDRGFYTDPFEVVVSSETDDATILYTLDGSSPGADHGTVYVGPIQIEGTTTLRAMAYKSGWRATNVDTHTYIFAADVVTQSPDGQVPGPGWPTGMVNDQVLEYGMDPRVTGDPRIVDALLALPSLSLVTDLENLFDPDTGIYVNAMNDGRDWERASSVELINPDGTGGFQANAGLRIRGGSSRKGEYPKHAWRLFFREEYGNAKLEFPLFGDEGVDQFDKVDLRTHRSATRNTFVRDVFSRDTQGEMGQPYTRSRYYHLYLNGVYWGVFQTQERPEARYAASYFGGDRDDYDVIKRDGPADGNTDAWSRLGEATVAGFGGDEAYYGIQGLDTNGLLDSGYERLLDLDAVMDYQLIVYYTGNLDASPSWFAGDTWSNNYYWVYNRENPDGFQLFIHDAEMTMHKGSWVDPDLPDELYRDRTGPFTGLDEFGDPVILYFPFPPHHVMCDPCGQLVWTGNSHAWNPQWAHVQLMAHPEYRMAFADRVHRYFLNGGLLTPEAVDARFMSRANEIDLAIIAESARWGDSRGSSLATRDNAWLSAINRLRNEYFPFRSDIVLDQIKSHGWYPNVDAPVFVEQHGGLISPPFTLNIDNRGSGALYYTLDGSDPRGPASFGPAPAPVGIAEDAPKRVLVPTGTGDLNQGGTSWTDLAFDDSGPAWAGGTGGVGYERSSGYEAFIGIDVEADMFGTNGTALIRIPFTLTAQELSESSCLTLRMRFDDGFVAYLNGTEVARANAPANLIWNAVATSIHDDGQAVAFEDFTIDEFLGDLVEGPNVLAVMGLNAGLGSSDFLISVALDVRTTGCGGGGSPPVMPVGPVSPGAIVYGGPITLTETTHVMARVLDGGEWSALNEATFVSAALREDLRITEIMYHPQNPDAEFVELTNVGGKSINLVNTSFTRGIDFTFPGIILLPGEYVLLVKNTVAFESVHGSGLPVAGEYTGSLDNAGERIRLEDPTGATILDFSYSDGWYPITDGVGFSLTIVDPTTDSGVWDAQDGWRASAVSGGSPGEDDEDLLPVPGTLVINEVLAHSHAGDPDWIEIHNTGDTAVNLGGWYLSDNGTDLTKYEIASGTVVGAGDHIVFCEHTPSSESFCESKLFSGFALSENGETVYLSSAVDGILTGYREAEGFGASESNVAFGRYAKSTGTFNFVAMSENTPGAGNAYPRVGPIVINEIMYHPASGDEGEEYIELHNVSASPVVLQEHDVDKDETIPWQFTDGIVYALPTGTTIPANGFLLVVKDPTGFSFTYTVPGGVVVLGPYEGQLSNGGEKVEISKPGDVDGNGERQYIRIDRINYDDADPWPPEADGMGSSLTRKQANQYGNDAVNWSATSPTPGS